MSRDAWASETEPLDAYPYVCVGCRAVLREHGGLCPSCFRSGLIFSRYRRVADEYLPTVPGVTAQELARSLSRVFTVEACPGLLLGPGAFVVTHGGPGAGKTTQLLKVADSLQPSVAVMLEMGVGPLLASMLRRLEIVTQHVTFHEPRDLPAIFELAKTPQLRCLLIDSLSVSTLRPDDARSLAGANGIVVWGTLQETKSGTFRGSNEWAHAADVILSVADMRWTLTKSRYQEIGLQGTVFCDTANISRACSA